MNSEARALFDLFTDPTETQNLAGGTNTLTGMEIITSFANCPSTYRDLFAELLRENLDVFFDLACARTRTAPLLIPNNSQCKFKENRKGTKLSVKCAPGFCPAI